MISWMGKRFELVIYPGVGLAFIVEGGWLRIMLPFLGLGIRFGRKGTTSLDNGACWHKGCAFNQHVSPHSHCSKCKVMTPRSDRIEAGDNAKAIRSAFCGECWISMVSTWCAEVIDDVAGAPTVETSIFARTFDGPMPKSGISLVDDEDLMDMS